MKILDNLVVDSNGYFLSATLVLLAIVFFVFNKRLLPKFVAPSFSRVFSKLLFEKFILFSIIFFIILLPMKISYIKEMKIINEKTLNIQILFDVSLSMTADDIQPSRFIAAKNSLIELVNNLEGYNISIITFSGIPFVRSPYSDETKAIESKLNKMQLSDFPPTVNFVGTAIGDAILLGINNLKNQTSNPDKPGLIILLTDGDSNKGTNPEQAAKISFNKNIPIYTLAIGKKEYVVGNDYLNNPVITTINIPLLKKISEISDGKFYRVLEKQEFEKIFNEIAKFVKKDEKQKILYEFENINKYLIPILGLLIFVYLVIRLKIIVGIFKK